MKTLVELAIASLIIVASFALLGCDDKSEPTEKVKAEKTELGITTSGNVGLRLNDVQCMNMTNGQIEVCLITIE